MNTAILIPTFSGHLQFNERFLKSIREHGSDAEIFFCAPRKDCHKLRTMAEGMEGINFIEALCPIERWTGHRKFAFITVKKLWAINEIFQRYHHDAVVVLDSEVIALRRIRQVDLASDTVWHSPRIYETNHMHSGDCKRDAIAFAKVKDDGNEFYRGWEWFNQLCLFKRALFQSLMDRLMDAYDDWGGLGDNVPQLCFDHPAYLAYACSLGQVDARSLAPILMKVFGRNDLQRLEDIQFNYDGGNAEQIIEFLREIRAPWVPRFDAGMTQRILSAVPSVCFQFHLDR